MKDRWNVSIVSLILLCWVGVTGCYQPIDMTPAEKPELPWVYCILNPDDSVQQLRLCYLSPTGQHVFTGIDDASVSLLAEWGVAETKQSQEISFINTGNGIWRFKTTEANARVFTYGTFLYLHIVLSNGVTLVSSDEVYTIRNRPRIIETPNDNNASPFFEIYSSPAIWTYFIDPSTDTYSLGIADDIKTDREDLVDAFNKLDGEWHYRFLRIIDGRGPRTEQGQPHSSGGPIIHMDTLSFYGKKEKVHHQYVVFHYVTRGYDQYLKAVAQYELLRGVSTDIIGVYDNKNVYSNIEGGAGIFGVETVSTYDLQNEEWITGRP